MAEDGYWRFCDILERQVVSGPRITAPPHVERVVLEQHTETGAYRLRSLDEVMDDVDLE